MRLSPAHEKLFRRLFDHYARVDEQRGAQVKSLQAPFEAQMEAKAKMQRHRAIRVRDGCGSYVVKGSDIGCGCDAHGHGDHFASPDRVPFDVDDEPQLARPNAIATALRWLGGTVNRQLEMIARDPLPVHMQAFGAPFKADGGERALQRAPLLGVAQEPARGPGNLAPLTNTAVALWGTRAGRIADALARRVYARQADQPDRDLARAIKTECAAMAEEALNRLDATLGSVDRRPLVMVRAGRVAAKGY